MKRHYYISDDLDDLDVVEHTLEAKGVSTPQIHILSENEASIQAHHLHGVEDVLKKDVVRATEIGFGIGLFAAGAVLILAYFSGFTETYTWVPAIFLAIVILGFCTWEGGFIGIQRPHNDFLRFQDDLRAGKHVLFVDVPLEQEDILKSVIDEHPKLTFAGLGDASPAFVVGAQKKWHKFTRWAP